jgi:hydrogenase maturation protease
MSARDRIWYLLVSAPPDTVEVNGRVLSRGCRVRLAPQGRGDLLDSVLAGKTGRVESIDQDQDGQVHLSVSIDDDPGRDLAGGSHPAHRFFFLPSEVEPLDDTRSVSARRVLIAGIGNLFLGDDGFGVEVARRLSSQRLLPPGVEVADFGIRGMDLAYALGGGWDGVILVDALPIGSEPGTVVVLEPDLPDDASAAVAGHAMDPLSVLRLARNLGTIPEHALVVGCQPGMIPDVDDGDEMSTQLSPAVEAAVEVAVDRIVELVDLFLERGRFAAELETEEKIEMEARK